MKTSSSLSPINYQVLLLWPSKYQLLSTSSTWKNKPTSLYQKIQHHHRPTKHPATPPPLPANPTMNPSGRPHKETRNEGGTTEAANRAKKSTPPNLNGGKQNSGMPRDVTAGIQGQFGDRHHHHHHHHGVWRVWDAVRYRAAAVGLCWRGKVVRAMPGRVATLEIKKSGRVKFASSSSG